MSFVSPEFLLLFVIVAPLYHLLPYRYASPVLLIGSYIFYMYWNAWWVLILLFTTIFDFHLAKAIFRTGNPVARRLYLTASICINLGVLFFFKYANFASASLQSLFELVHVPFPTLVVDVVLPIGISFYTFQEMAYTIDVYRGVIEPERRFDIFSLFILFFPHLIAGPIVRAPVMLPQFRIKQRFDEASVVEGLQLMLWGAFKKVVIADRLAEYVNNVYGNPSQYSGPVLALATFFFAFQIYCDFSGYSDLAIGTAKVMGFRLMTNFRQPYFSPSVTEFWRRWHISLSTWFKDYVYFPLGGSQVRVTRWAFNVLVVFLLSGLWHGADWKFVIWGGLHGCALLTEAAAIRLGLTPTRLFGRFTSAATAVKTGLTFLFVCGAWVFFRAASVGDAWHIFRHLAAVPAGQMGLRTGFADPNDFTLSLFLIAVLLVIDVLEARGGLNVALVRVPRPLRWAIYYGTTVSVIWLGVWGRREFIYFQF